MSENLLSHNDEIMYQIRLDFEEKAAALLREEIEDNKFSSLYNVLKKKVACINGMMRII